jgi:3D (Asp-Asp-Asp) domain-containing protein
MRWRLFVFILSVTALFCFMLLTAATGYSTQRSFNLGQALAALIPGQPTSPAALNLAINTSSNSRPAFPGPESFDYSPRPRPVDLFVPSNADPYLARLNAEQTERAARGKPVNRRRLKWDEKGWFREEVALVTAYCPCDKCCGSGSYGRTSIGKNAWTTGLAADPDCLEYGTRVWVPGYGFSQVDDTGGAMRRNWKRNGIMHIDVRMTYHYEAKSWGKQYLRVKVYLTTQS